MPAAPATPELDAGTPATGSSATGTSARRARVAGYIARAMSVTQATDAVPIQDSTSSAGSGNDHR